jgi:hydroxymethylbilane synthase
VKQIIVVGARASPLSQAQVKEVFAELCNHLPQIDYLPIWTPTQGDMDQKTSLKGLEKSNFFTKEIDSLLLKEGCRIAVHSAKDLPEPLPQGIQLVAITRGIDPSDALVMRKESTLASLPPMARVGTSSARREQVIKQLRPDIQIVDIRGTIEKRLAMVEETGELDAVVIAEAALMRLGLTHLNRLRLPGETALYQGQLAILARTGDNEMQEIFSMIHHPQKTCLF